MLSNFSFVFHEAQNETRMVRNLSGNFVERRGLLRSLMPEKEVEYDRIADVSVDVPQPEAGEEKAAESSVGTVEDNTAANDDEVAHDVQSVSDVHDVGDDATARKLQQLAKQLYSQVIVDQSINQTRLYSVCQESDTILVSEFLPLLDALYLQFLFTYISLSLNT